eukprot:TRINITY_DN24127_c0_g1_i1.p1 TRINITY_DN24127_c0_g1~~TRINITY_DN24127_c0_g1_i1.p1  ORF type:complete len:270 (+),score=41.83 TRINITY_DN24127_c0_g1_i1:113-922(+)
MYFPVISFLLVVAPAAADSWAAAAVPNNTLDGALDSATEGVAYDVMTKRWFFNSRSAIWVANDTFAGALQTNADCFPPLLKKQGYAHLGDADFFNNTLYIPASSWPDTHHHCQIVAYDATSLELRGVLGALPQTFCPFVAIQPATGLLWSTEFWNATTVNAFQLPSLRQVASIPLSQPIPLMQGGVFHPHLQDVLFLGSGLKGHNQRLWSVNVSSGEVVSAVTRHDTNEVEGMAWVDLRASHRGTLHYFDGQHTGARRLIHHFTTPFDF